MVDNDRGAIDPGVGAATLTGALTNGVATERFIYWGDNDGGTDPAAWDNEVALGLSAGGSFTSVVNGLIYGVPYFYRCYASNNFGVAWAPAGSSFKSERFIAPVMSVSNGLALWLDAADASTLWRDIGGVIPAMLDGDLVGRWDDKSGNARHVTDVSGNVPTLSASVSNLNNHSALFFDIDHLGRANDLGIVGNADRTVVSVWANHEVTGQNYQHTLHFGQPSVGRAYGHVAYRNSSGRIAGQMWGQPFNTTEPGTAAPTMALSMWDGDGGTGANGLNQWFVNR
ncbi:MAG: hypothetical protein AAF492_26590, partial [Verrucomicrobiota bacterium]